TPELKAIAREALHLGTHCVAAMARWLNDRRHQMRDQDEFRHPSQMQSERNRNVGSQSWNRDQGVQERQFGGRYAGEPPRTPAYGGQPGWDSDRYAGQSGQGTGSFYQQTQGDWRSDNEWERGGLSQGSGG